MKPRLLDLFCGAGGAAAGYHLAGFEVTGIDCKYQPNYPFDFVQTDAISFLERGIMSLDSTRQNGRRRWKKLQERIREEMHANGS